jgi:hypothetical protein
MKTKLLAGVALALILGVSSAAYANPKNSFNNGSASNSVTSTAANIQIGNISAGNGTDNGNTSESGGGNAVGVLNGIGNGDTTQGDSTNVGIANSESFNVEATGQSQQTLLGVSVLNIQANVANQSNSASAGNHSEAENEDNNAVAVLVNGGASSSIGNNNGGVTTSSAAAGVGSQNNVGISVGAGGIASF